MPVTNVYVPRLQNVYPPVPVYPVRTVGPTGPTGPAGGITATVITAKLTTGGTTGSMTFVNGLLTAQTAAA